MQDMIEKKLTVLSIVDPYFHVTNSGETVEASYNSDEIDDVVSVLQSDYCSHTFYQNYEHHKAGTTWYDFVNINSISIHNHPESISSTDGMLNPVEVLVFSDDSTISGTRSTTRRSASTTRSA